jgi:hypothetical protein
MTSEPIEINGDSYLKSFFVFLLQLIPVPHLAAFSPKH